MRAEQELDQMRDWLALAAAFESWSPSNAAFCARMAADHLEAALAKP